MSGAYYNENDPHAAKWLRNLIAAGHIAVGDVDERSIVDVQPDDLRGYERVHLFAGIAGWDLALQLAGWHGPVWTASCPCPPFSAAGKKQKCPSCESRLLVWCPRRTGYAICAACDHAWLADARHLWPEVWRLAAERRPAVLIGEQVASKDGREWLAGVRASLEMLGHAVTAADLCAAGIAAPHIRQRLFWVADARYDDWAARLSRRQHQSEPSVGEEPGSNGSSRRLADADGGQPCDGNVQRGGEHGLGPQDGRAGGGVADASGEQMGRAGQPWAHSVWLPCLDGKARRIEPGTFPLAHGAPVRMGRLRAYGNAIVPQVAAEFIRAIA